MADTSGQDGGPLEVGIAARTLAGQARRGDVHVVRCWDGGAVIAVIDGLGHGAAAADAAERAASVIYEHAGNTVIALVRRCHEALSGTRGVVMSVAEFDVAEATMSWLSIGNVEGVLLRADSAAEPRREFVLSRGGIVGLRLPLLRATVTSLTPGDRVIMATDGVRREFAHHVPAHLAPSNLAELLLNEYATGDDDGMVLVARYGAGTGAA